MQDKVARCTIDRTMNSASTAIDRRGFREPPRRSGTTLDDPVARHVDVPIPCAAATSSHGRPCTIALAPSADWSTLGQAKARPSPGRDQRRPFAQSPRPELALTSLVCAPM
jgi:hypothetical protein